MMMKIIAASSRGEAGFLFTSFYVSMLISIKHSAAQAESAKRFTYLICTNLCVNHAQISQ